MKRQRPALRVFSRNDTPESCNDGIVVIGGGINVIGEKAFYNDQTIRGILFPEGLIKISNKAFALCHNLRGVGFTGSRCNTIGNEAFLRTGLETVVLPSSIDTLGAMSFKQCLALRTFTAPGVTFIGRMTFSACVKLKYVAMHNLAIVGSKSFFGCKALDRIRFNISLLRTVGTEAFGDCGKLCIWLHQGKRAVYNLLLLQLRFQSEASDRFETIKTVLGHLLRMLFYTKVIKTPTKVGHCTFKI